MCVRVCMGVGGRRGCEKAGVFLRGGVFFIFYFYFLLGGNGAEICENKFDRTRRRPPSANDIAARSSIRASGDYSPANELVTSSLPLRYSPNSTPTTRFSSESSCEGGGIECEKKRGRKGHVVVVSQRTGQLLVFFPFERRSRSGSER